MHCHGQKLHLIQIFMLELLEALMIVQKKKKYTGTGSVKSGRYVTVSPRHNSLLRGTPHLA